ncbi:MAG: NAD-dependent epimerase/dehydratase family protein [Chloroflexota bacterium]
MAGPGTWAGKRVLITGAAGFIGSHLVRQLTGCGAHIFAATSPGRDPQPGPHPLPFDVRDGQAVRDAVDRAGPHVVFHLAAVGVTHPAVDPMLALMVNAGGAVNLLEALRERDVQRIVLVGTSHEYGAREAREGLDPFSAYAASKVAAWAYGRTYWRAFGLPVVTVRPFQVYGPGQAEEALIPGTIRAAISGEDFSVTPGEQELDFVYVEDVTDGMVAAAQAPDIEGESLDLGTGAGHTIRSIVDRIWRLTGAEGMVRVGALPYRSGGPMRLVADAERTAELVGWRATTPIEEGLRATIRSLAEER